MDKLNKKEIFEKYKNSDSLYPLVNGDGEVIGQEIVDNRLVYVIKKGENFDLQFAEHVAVIPILQQEVKIKSVPLVKDSGIINQIKQLQEDINILTLKVNELTKKKP